MKKIRVFLVDDSAVARHGLRRLLNHDDGIEVVGEAADGQAALRQVPRVNPDIVLMDVVMPGLDGLETTRELMARHARPVVLVSELVGRDADLNFRALEAGALDILGKPSACEIRDPLVARRWSRQVQMLAGVPVITRRRQVEVPPKASAKRPRKADLVCLGASTGGPPALHKILKALPQNPPWPVVVVQHITAGFTGGMARWLADVTGHQVELVERSTRFLPGTIYVAPDHQHLELRGQRLVPSGNEPRLGHRPSIDVLFETAAMSKLAPRTVAVLLTGMGEDGARGLAALRRAGAWTVAQDEGSCVVYGMPRVAVDIDAACEVLSIEEISIHLAALGALTDIR